MLIAWFGVEQVVWLGSGIAGDDTDGHIDDITRFVDEATIVTVVESDKDDANCAPLDENLRRLQALRISDQPATVIELPMPAPIYAGGERLPASYANFYIANDIVLVPESFF